MLYFVWRIGMKQGPHQLAFGKRHGLPVALAFTGGAGGISFQFTELNGLAGEEAAAGAVSAPLDGLFIRSRIKDSALSIGKLSIFPNIQKMYICSLGVGGAGNTGPGP